MATTGTKRFGYGTLAAAALVVWIGARAELRQPGTISEGVTSFTETGADAGAATINAAKGLAQDVGAGDLLAPAPAAPADEGGQLGGVAGEELGR